MITVLQKHYKAIGRKGGLSTLKKKGSKYFIELSKKAVKARKLKKQENLKN